ncbi:diguanylate cyclase [Sphingomonas sp. IC4-52]|uniref:sensor domain-containing diguanylate cyclase n=1 Tax=Sphingomonas sp. IC4-52 TaxID=2887202 RepID=UPI001D1086BA|nr:diguanylate cyclase [Sphingomonas sp. IC4-52]MCC2981423.1 diguanylate cyclase [Sphingomonas sp. IC4-52]
MSLFKAIGRLLRFGLAKRPDEDMIFRSIVEQSGDVICHVSDGRFTYVSPSAKAVFGWSPDAMIGSTGFELIYEPDLPILEEVLARRVSGEEVGPVRHQLRVVCGDGSLKWSETSARSERAANGKILHTILVIRDVSDRKRLEEELEALAHKDGLTGLANRRSFDRMLERSWQQTLRVGSEMALILIDIDHFKRFNDSYGHQAGDDCLRAVAAAVGRFARRPGDLACRYGGEEFALVLSETGPFAALELAEEVRSAVATLNVPHEGNSTRGRVTVSVGVATAIARAGGSFRMPESLVQAADHALYKAKAGGRNRVEQSVLIAPFNQK